MELLPIIYTSLLIVAALFVITVAISYISYKIKGNKDVYDDSDKTRTYKTFHSSRNNVEQKLKTYSRTENLQQLSQKIEAAKFSQKKTLDLNHRQTSKIAEEKNHLITDPQKSNKRIERVTKLVSSKNENEITSERSKEKYEEKSDEQKLRKNLKSVGDNPLERYTDSADDDLHPLKTDK